MGFFCKWGEICGSIRIVPVISRASLHDLAAIAYGSDCLSALKELIL